MPTATGLVPRRPPGRPAFTLTELLVAATLLAAVLSVMAQLTVRTGRLRQEARHEQLALGELANQLDRLLSADETQRSELLASLTPTAQMTDILPEAHLVGEELRDEQGRRLVLTISWKRAAAAKPLTLVGWIRPLPEEAAPSPLTEITP